MAIYEAVAALMESSMVDFDVAEVLRGRSGGTLPGVAPANAYPTSDGSEVLIAGNADTVFARLCDAMGRPELAADERYATHVARGEHERELDAIVGEWTSTIALRRAACAPAGTHRAGRTGVHRGRHAARRALCGSGDDRASRVPHGHRHPDARRGAEVLTHARQHLRRRPRTRRTHRSVPLSVTPGVRPPA